MLGCYTLTPDLTGVFGDSLSYRVPKVIRLVQWPSGQWVVLPTAFDYHPTWTITDGLPSGYVARRRGNPPYHIPGDSIDVYFPGPLGSLVLRLGKVEGGLRGHAAWVTKPNQEFDLKGVSVLAGRSGCERLRASLESLRN